MATKQKPKKRKRTKRTIKQRAYFIHAMDEETVHELAERVLNARNYMYSRLAGINSLALVHGTDRAIRDAWTKDKELVQQFKLPARFWKITLSEVVGSLKSMWSNTFNRVKHAAKDNGNLTEDEKQYVRYLCSAPKLVANVLTKQPFTLPKKLEILSVRTDYVHSLLRRYVRRYKGKIPYGKSLTFQVDADMYRYKVEGDKLYLDLSTHHKTQRLSLACVGKRTFKKNIKVILQDGYLALHHTVETKCAEIEKKTKVSAIDKGYKTMLVSSHGNHYGTNLHTMLSEETERLNAVNAKRNPIYAQVRLLEEKGQTEKAERIRVNNLGLVKYNRQKNRHDATVKSMVNHELNRFLDTEDPHIVPVEDLSFVSWHDWMPKHVKRKLSRWIKGYIDERLSFKCAVRGIDYIYVNPAYTSQECHQCGCLGNRKNQQTFICPHCGSMHADENAAKTIENRLNDSEISLYTPYKQVKRILTERTNSYQIKKGVPILHT